MFRPSANTVFVAAALVGVAGVQAQPTDPPPNDNEAAQGSPVAASGQAETAVVADGSESAADRTRLNLLGEVNSEQGEGRRNENVRLTLIDNNVLRELNERLGISATAVKSFQIDRSYWATEFGGPPGRPVHVPAASVSRINGNAFWTHTNSAVSARSFFQVGSVQPARSNDYGVTVGLPAWDGAGLTLTGSQTRNKGQVNGNVLVPTIEERVPLASDPQTRAFVQRIMDAYPVATPNRPDINPRALNTNAPQDISNDRASATLDQQAGPDGRVTLRYNLVLQQVDAFQLVGGQNPNTTTRNHQARMTWNRSWSPRLTSDFTVGFDRVGSLLIPDESSIGPWIRAGIEITSIGPPGRFPVDRAGNNFRYGARARYRAGSHNLVFRR